MVKVSLPHSDLQPLAMADMTRGNSALTPALCRAARGALEWTQEELALRSRVSRSTIKDYEGGKHSIHRSTAAQIVSVFEAEGLIVIRAPGLGFGLWKAEREDSDPVTT
jgi:transcriptional regulator with XRE-family HTH domain